jgi:nicotinamide riboside transporter PnuC
VARSSTDAEEEEGMERTTAPPERHPLAVLWLPGTVLVVGVITMIVGNVWIGLIATLLGLIMLGALARRRRRERVIVVRSPR